MQNTQTVSQQLAQEVNWNAFFQMVKDLGSQLNERQLRFLKARLIEKGIANLSKNIKWVDRIGQDHQLHDIRIETKFATNSITTGKGAWKKKGCTSEIKLTNSLGSSDGRQLPHTFDYLMIVDTDCVGLVAYEDITATSNGDGLKASISYDVMSIVVKHEATLTETKNINILEQLDSMLDTVINSYAN